MGRQTEGSLIEQGTTCPHVLSGHLLTSDPFAFFNLKSVGDGGRPDWLIQDWLCELVV